MQHGAVRAAAAATVPLTTVPPTTVPPTTVRYPADGPFRASMVRASLVSSRPLAGAS
jgi:hypothetical protein